MKIYILIFIVLYTCISFPQPETFEDELIIHLVNYNNSSVTATATRVQLQGAKWYPNNHQYAYTIIGDNSYNTVVSGNAFSTPDWGSRIFFDLESDQNPNKTLAISFYKISFSGNKLSTFYVNSVSIDMADVHLTFDYVNDKLYWGECTSCTNEIFKTDIFYTYNSQNTLDLEDYWENGLYAALETHHPAKMVWSKYSTNNTIQKYRVYKAITPYSTAPNESEFEWLTELPSSSLTFQDMHIQEEFGDQYAYFFVKAYYFNGSSYVWSDKTNVVRSQIIFQDWESTLHIGRSGDHPRLVWWPYPESNNTILSYKIYRAVTSPAVPPQTPVYSLLTTVDNDVFSFDDQTFIQGNNILHYYIKAVLNPPEDGSPFDSEASNVVVTTGGLYKEVAETTQPALKNYLLFDNYPNPFNPTTNIQYSIPTDGLVTLKVFDILGREVSTLVNESKSAGSYSVNFNALTLASGTYIYQLRAGEFLSTKKMLMLK